MIQQPNEFSLSQLWVLGGAFGEDLNSIEAGWQVGFKRKYHLVRRQWLVEFISRLYHNVRPLQVSPDLYGDNNTRLFTYWTVSLS